MKNRSYRRLFFVFAIFSSLMMAGFDVHATIGAPCDISSGDPDDPLIRACDRCLGEFCDGQTNTCAQGPAPVCPEFQEFLPGCWTTCENTLEDSDGFFIVPTCAPNDSFCNDISGGDESNQCRVGVCTDVGDIDPSNPSGCDYTLEPDLSVDCRQCIPDGLATLENCGNGICEPDEGEACGTCSIDCRTPGYDGACLTDQAQLDALCLDPAGITFPGPPYPNTPQDPGGLCEDGNLCTTNTCGLAGTPQVGQCVVTQLGCEPDNDFCCPAGCEAPAPGGSCREVTGFPIPGCDPDCYVPEECIPTPSPTPTPPPPVFLGCLEGSGSLSGTGGPGCSGFACSLNTAASAAPGLGLALSILSMLGIGAYRAFRKYRG